MISCSQYDYIEIVCMFNYPIELTLKSGCTTKGIALDTAKNTEHEECIKVLVEECEQLVVLDDISQLKVLVENPHFSHVSFD
ncbi:Rho-binding antiterminator [Pseudoalteromonas pernae]|uniref:Rho-binding antiterminator n=1 Tax=Pseudoalteromonas pernae TaxID=3118054 RepID=UPI0032428A1E